MTDENEVAQSSPSKILDTGMTLYEMNKNIIKNLPNLSEEELESSRDELRKFIRTRYHNNKYFMLLCNELKYYTIFDRNEKDSTLLPYMQDEVIDCLNELGDIKSIELNSENVIECWIENEDGINMLLFFPYDRGVIRCR